MKIDIYSPLSGNVFAFGAFHCRKAREKDFSRINYRPISRKCWEGAACGRCTFYEVVGKVCSCVLSRFSMPLMPLRKRTRVILLRSTGRTINVMQEKKLAQEDELIFICILRGSTTVGFLALCPDGWLATLTWLCDGSVPEVIGKSPATRMTVSPWSLRVSSIHPALWIQEWQFRCL